MLLPSLNSVSKEPKYWCDLLALPCQTCLLYDSMTVLCEYSQDSEPLMVVDGSTKASLLFL